MAAHTHTTSELPTALVLRDGSRDFTGRVKGVDPVASEDLVTKGYVDRLANSAEVGTALVGFSSVSGAAGGANASRIQGRPVSDAEPEVGDALVWDGSEWVPTTVEEEDEAQDVTAGIQEFPLNSFEVCTVGVDEAMFTYSPGTTAGHRNYHETTVLAAPAAVQTNILQVMTRLPATYVPGDALKVRVRLYGALAEYGTTLDLLAYRNAGKVGAPLADVCSTAAQAVRGYTVGLDSIVGQAKASEAPYREIEFTLDGTDLGPGDPLTMHLRFAYDNVGAVGLAGTFQHYVTWAGLVYGSHGWRVGWSSMIGSALVE